MADQPTDSESASDRYERLAAAFHAETGMMAPGKDVPAACGSDDYEARYDAWVRWLGGQRACRCGHLSREHTMWNDCGMAGCGCREFAHAS